VSWLRWQLTKRVYLSYAARMASMRAKYEYVRFERDDFETDENRDEELESKF
jgi:hypothetical protein